MNEIEEWEKTKIGVWCNVIIEIYNDYVQYISVVKDLWSQKRKEMESIWGGYHSQLHNLIQGQSIPEDIIQTMMKAEAER
jgi:hypothetical protein